MGSDEGSPLVGDMSFPSSGDAERDVETARLIRRSQARLSEGMCPNGCSSPLVNDSDSERHCPDCGYMQAIFGGTFS